MPPNDPARPSSGPFARLGLSRRTLILIGIAFAIGLLLFAMLWLDQRNDDEFYRAGAPPASRDGQVFEPLPTPDAAGSDPVARTQPPPGEMDAPLPSTDGVIEEVPADSAALPFPPENPAPPPVSGPAGATSAVPIYSPQPRFPPDALRRGETGSVLVQALVDQNGAPVIVNVVQSSRSRDLDREALRAVQAWRFKPATRNGQAVESKVLIPIDFRP